MSREKLLKRKKGEIFRAGRLLFNSLLHDDSLDDVARRLMEEEQQDQEERQRHAPPAPVGAPLPAADVIAAEGYSFVRCAACGREQAIPANEDVFVLEQVGWVIAQGKWRCRFCVARGRQG